MFLALLKLIFVDRLSASVFYEGLDGVYRLAINGLIIPVQNGVLLYPLQNRVLGGYTVFSMSEIPSFCQQIRFCIITSIPFVRF